MSKRILTSQDQFRVQNITDVQVSRDGRQVVYTTQAGSLEEDKSSTSLWLLRLDQTDAKPVRLTSHPTDASARFSPDGERIAFVSRRDGKAQLYLISTSGGEAERLKTKQAPSSAPLWSPDGQTITFKALVDRPRGPRYPGEPEELQAKSADEQAEQSDKDAKSTVQVISDINYHADGTGMIHHQFAQLFTVQLADGQCTQQTCCSDRLGDFAWTNSGKSLIYLLQSYDEQKVRNTTNIRQVDVANQADMQLCHFDGALSSVQLSPDGHWLLCAGTDNCCPQGTGDAQLWVLNLAGALPLQFDQAICLTAGQGTNCQQANWNETGDGVYFLRHWHGTTEMQLVDFHQGTVGTTKQVKLTDLAMVTQYAIGGNQGRLVFAANDFVHPPELYLHSQTAKRQLTDLHGQFKEEFDLCPAERYTYQGADGWAIDGWLIRPLNYEAGRRYPTVLSIHGGPTGAYYDSFQFPFQLLAHQGFAVILTNPRGSVTYGSAFAQGCVDDLGGKDYQDIMAGVDRAIELGVVDANRLGVMGWSYGGYMTCWMVTQTERFRAAIGGANISNWYTLYGCSDSHIYAEGLWEGPAFDNEEKVMTRSPMRYVRQVKTPILLLHGEADIRCPIGQSEQFYLALKRLGREAVFVRYPGQFHGVVKPTYLHDRWARTVAWFRHYLLD